MSTGATSLDLLTHPEWVEGRRLWIDGAMRDVIHKLQHGDPIRGWEGDPNLAVYWDQPNSRWEVWRLEHDGEYRKVCHSRPGVPFDERLIDELVSWDNRRRSQSIHDEIVARNLAVDAAKNKRIEEWVSEEIGPRMRSAFTKDL